MTIFWHPKLDFTRNALKVAYRAAPEPQKLLVDVTMATALRQATTPIMMRNMVNAINDGMAGGAVFSPDACRAKVLSGTLELKKIVSGPNFQWELEVASVDPLFLRVMVETMSTGYGTGFGYAEALAIVGTLPPDGSDASVDTVRMQQWLSDPNAFPAQWPKPPFEVRPLPKPRSGGVVHMHMAGKPSKAAETALKVRAFELTSYAIPTFNAALSSVAQLGLPRVSSTKSRFTITWDGLDVHPPIFRAALVNMACRFHSEHGPIAFMELALP